MKKMLNDASSAIYDLFSPLPIYLPQEDGNKSESFIALRCEAIEEHETLEKYFTMSVSVILRTIPNESSNDGTTEEEHRAIAKQLYEFLDCRSDRVNELNDGNGITVYDLRTSEPRNDVDEGNLSIIGQTSVVTLSNSDISDLPTLDDTRIILRNGFIYYDNTENPTSLDADTWVTIPNNGQGSLTNKSFSPPHVTDLINENDGSIDVSELNLGDTILIRNTFSIIPNGNNALLELRYTLASSNVIETFIERLSNGSGTEYKFSLKPDIIDISNQDIKDNPIFIQIKLSTNGILNNTGSLIQVIRR